MKKKAMLLIVCLLLLFLLCYPKEALQASKDGLKLWLETLLPTLLPFMILTNILIHTEGITKIVHPIAPFFKVFFGLSPNGAYAFILGLLCGYPMGAKLAGDLYHAGKIGRQEAEYLLTFCNNPSPAFLITYVGNICLEGKIGVGKLAGILFGADMICMCFFRFIYRKNCKTRDRGGSCKRNYIQICSAKTDINKAKTDANKAKTNVNKTEVDINKTEMNLSKTDWGMIIDNGIMNGFETITRLGGYILLFSILSACISHFWFLPLAGKYIFLGILELTTGLHGLVISGFSYQIRVLLAMCFSSFGGFCIMAQTKSVLGKELSLLPYASAKCMNTAVTAILILIFL